MTIIKDSKKLIALSLSVCLLALFVLLSGFVYNQNGPGSFPVTVEVQGKTKTVMTTETTAQALADKLGYKAPFYAVIGDRNQSIQKDSVVKIGYVSKRVKQTVSRPIPIETIRERDDKMSKGEERVVQTGEAGFEAVQEEVLFDGDTQIGVNVIKRDVLKEMEPRIVKVGTRENTVETSRGAVRYSKVLTMHATAYTTAEGNGDGITASGIPATRGVVAVDPSIIPLGTKLFIPGYGEALAADTGGAIQGNRIDLLMDTKSEAYAFGRQNITVYVLQQ